MTESQKTCVSRVSEGGLAASAMAHQKRHCCTSPKRQCLLPSCHPAILLHPYLGAVLRLLRWPSLVVDSLAVESLAGHRPTRPHRHRSSDRRLPSLPLRCCSNWAINTDIAARLHKSNSWTTISLHAPLIASSRTNTLSRAALPHHIRTSRVRLSFLSWTVPKYQYEVPQYTFMSALDHSGMCSVAFRVPQGACLQHPPSAAAVARRSVFRTAVAFPLLSHPLPP